MPEEQKSEQPVTSVEVNYKQSYFSRVIHVDGAWGGVTPQGQIHMALYSEHQPVPEQTMFMVASGQEKVKLSVERPQLVREIETEAIMTPAVALAIRNWIDGRLATLEELQKKAHTPNPEKRAR